MTLSECFGINRYTVRVCGTYYCILCPHASCSLLAAQTMLTRDAFGAQGNLRASEFTETAVLTELDPTLRPPLARLVHAATVILRQATATGVPATSGKEAESLAAD
jgi:hypothetical protein